MVAAELMRQPWPAHVKRRVDGTLGQLSEQTLGCFFQTYADVLNNDDRAADDQPAALMRGF
jgi:hypothetical protein